MTRRSATAVSAAPSATLSGGSPDDANTTILVWLRRDLRLSDHTALAQALRHAQRVYCAFVFDRAILDPLLAIGARVDRRVQFILRSLADLDARLRQAGSTLIVRHGYATEEIPRLAQELRAGAVYANRDYEPEARAMRTSQRH